MSKLITIIGIILLVGAVAVPVMAWGPHWGNNHHMMGYWNSSPHHGRCDYSNLTTDQKKKLDTLNEKFYKETGELRNKIWTKFNELKGILNTTNPDIDKAKGLQKEISELRTKLDEKRLTYDLEARKILPEGTSDYYYHRGSYGHHMFIDLYGHGMDYMPGGGYCWN